MKLITLRILLALLLTSTILSSCDSIQDRGPRKNNGKNWRSKGKKNNSNNGRHSGRNKHN